LALLRTNKAQEEDPDKGGNSRFRKDVTWESGSTREEIEEEKLWEDRDRRRGI
jgi:hypothetical protein